MLWRRHWGSGWSAREDGAVGTETVSYTHLDVYKRQSSTFLTLILIPTFYLLFCGKDGQTPKKRNFHPIRRLRARFA